MNLTTAYAALKDRACRYLSALFLIGMVSTGYCIPAYTSSGGTTTGTLAETLDVFSDVFTWFLKEGGNLLAWMLGKPIILLSLSVFFVGAVVGMLARIYSSF